MAHAFDSVHLVVEIAELRSDLARRDAQIRAAIEHLDLLRKELGFNGYSDLADAYLTNSLNLLHLQ